MKGAIQSVSVSCFVHATEDESLVTAALARLVPEGTVAKREPLEGHYGNTIVHLEYHVTGAQAEKALSGMLAKMRRASKEELLREMPVHVDEHSSLYLRLDKQRLVHGEVATGGADPVRVKVKPRMFMLKNGAPMFYSELIRGWG